MTIVLVSLVIISLFLLVFFLFQEIHFIYLKDFIEGRENIPAHTHTEYRKPKIVKKIHIYLAHKFPFLRKKFHIVYNNENWVLKKQKSNKIILLDKNKEELIQRSMVLVRQMTPSQLIIHKKNGQFQEERTYGSDPTQSKG